MRQFLILLIAISVPIVVKAQYIVIKDSQTKEPISHVMVQGFDENRFLFTDDEGKVNISTLMSGEKIVLQMVGYQKKVLLVKEIRIENLIIFMEKQITELDRVVISAGRWKKNRNQTSAKITSLSPEKVFLNAPQTAADLLGESGEVYIQKSQMGGGSPMIRGFATNRVQLSVDGIRMNSAIFRSGNLHNVISIDPFSIEKTEILFGPGSVSYGSDAIGGVMSFYTKESVFSDSDAQLIQMEVNTRYHSANFEKTFNTSLSFSDKRWATTTVLTFSDFGDLRMGSHGPDDYLRKEYVITQSGVDLVKRNKRPELQKGTAYQSYHFYQTFRFKINEQSSVKATSINSTTSTIPRYDRLIEYSSSDQLRNAEWYYGPQIWSLNYLQYHLNKEVGIYDNLVFTPYYQYFRESRNSRRFGSDLKRNQIETVDIYGFNMDAQKKINTVVLSYGAEWVSNQIRSKSTMKHILNNEKSDAAPRYPDGSSWISSAAFLNAYFDLTSSWKLNTGLRYNMININAEFNSLYYNFPFHDANLEFGSLSGSLGIIYQPEESWLLGLNIATGFRAPNIDDMGKLFDSEPGNLIIPNPDLKSEYAKNIDLLFRHEPNEFINYSLSGYLTRLEGAMIRKTDTFSGSDSVLYDGVLSRVQSLQNAAYGLVYGTEAGVSVLFNNGISVRSQLNWQGGYEMDEDNTEIPLRHTAPLYGSTSLIYHYTNVRSEFQILYNGSKSHSELAPSEKNKPMIYALDKNGDTWYPGWYSVNLKTMYRVNDSLWFSIQLQNLTDQRYRTYSSGISAPGRSVALAVKIML